MKEEIDRLRNQCEQLSVRLEETLSAFREKISVGLS